MPKRRKPNVPTHVRRVERHRKRARGTPPWLGFTWKDVKSLYGQQNGCCYYCNRPFNNDYSRATNKKPAKNGNPRRSVHTAIFHLEHKEPLSRGGSNQLHNICLACPKCNMNKGTMTAHEFFHFRRRKGRNDQVVLVRKRGSGDERRVTRPLAATADQTAQPPG